MTGLLLFIAVLFSKGKSSKLSKIGACFSAKAANELLDRNLLASTYEMLFSAINCFIDFSFLYCGHKFTFVAEWLALPQFTHLGVLSLHTDAS
uniref:Putative secreted protein n=1 Tax=Panstrongylus lignarius TaxID=156445 RepID=A0A224XRF6_9HEMI